MSSADTTKQPSEDLQTQLESPESQPDVAAPEAQVADQTPQPQDGMNPALRREISVEIPAEVANREWDGRIQSYALKARVPGFRHGKVPASVIRQRFGQQIKSDVLESLVPDFFRQAIQKEGLRPISQPLVRNLEMEPGQPIRFKAAFEVLPEIQLGPYQEIKVERPEIPVTDEDVESELQRMQEQRASFDPVEEDRPLQDGDFAQISFKVIPKSVPAADDSAAAPDDSPSIEAKPQAEPADPQDQAPTQKMEEAMEDALVEIGGIHTIAEFSENLRGLKPGEERTFDVSYPEDFYDKRLAGKNLSYAVKVNSLKKKTIPDMNDDFAKELSQEFETLDDLKKRMREGMALQRKSKVEHDAKEKLMEQLIEQHDFPVPEALVERQIDIRLERGLRALAHQGMSEEDMKRMDFRRLRVGQREAAIKEVKSTLLLDKIAEVENIEISDEELVQEINALAGQMKTTPEALRKELDDDGLDRLRGRMRTNKALESLYSKSA
ncbi:MAG TPA: trigger factor [Candidatus Angelobacter sp.]|nr:trigger factor [Candidatus Angelobacter sp.]